MKTHFLTSLIVLFGLSSQAATTTSCYEVAGSDGAITLGTKGYERIVKPLNHELEPTMSVDSMKLIAPASTATNGQDVVLVTAIRPMGTTGDQYFKFYSVVVALDPVKCAVQRSAIRLGEQKLW